MPSIASSITAPAGTVVRSNRRRGQSWGFRPSKRIVVSAPWFVPGLFRSRYVSSPVAPGWRVRSVIVPEVAASVTSPGDVARSMFTSLSGPAKSAAVVLFHHVVCDAREAVPPEIAAFVSAYCAGVEKPHTAVGGLGRFPTAGGSPRAGGASASTPALP